MYNNEIWKDVEGYEGLYQISNLGRVKRILFKNNVNKPYKYHQFYNNDFKNISLYSGFDIMKIQRYIKVLGLYVLKTVYKRY